MREWDKMSVQLCRVREPHKEYTGPIWMDKKEDETMQVTYNGFTGELVKLERTFAPYPYVAKYATYDLVLSILKDGVCAKVSFTGVKMEDVKFLGGMVSFG